MGVGRMMRRDPYRRAMRRARRSWRGRDGAYPMLIIGPDEPVGLIVAGIIARWAWRHRSAFVPFAVTAAAFAIAAQIHGPAWATHEPQATSTRAYQWSLT